MLSSQPKMISDEEVLRSASGGLALEGLYKTGNLEDLLKKRQQLVEVPEEFSLRGPEKRCCHEQKKFLNYQSQTEFQKVSEKLGFSFDSSLNAWLPSVSAEWNVKYSHFSKAKESRKDVSEHNYISETKYNYIPLASCFFEKHVLKLSPSALKDLREIETILLNISEDQMGTKLQDRVRSFFERFGSHVNQGPLHFGGVYWWRASAEGFSHNERTTVENLTSNALDFYAGGGVSEASSRCSGGVAMSLSRLKEHFSGKYSERLLSKVQLSVIRSGGPAETEDHTKWKSGLVASNKTWCVIDRGTTLIPVWEIILFARHRDFKNNLKLSMFIKKAYEEITQQSVGSTWGDSVLAKLAEVQDLMKSVKTWSTENSGKHLSKLLDIKAEIKEGTGSYNAWIHTCLADCDLQDFLMKVVRDRDETRLKVMMQFVMDHADHVDSFPNRAQILEWTRESGNKLQQVPHVTQMRDLEEALQQARDDLHACYTSKVQSQVTSDVAHAFNSICETLREDNQCDKELLILFFVELVGYKHTTFNPLLGSEEITFLVNTLPDTFYKYSSLKESSESQAQAYLLHTALTLSKDGNKVSFSDKEFRLNQFQLQMKDKILENLRNAIQMSGDAHHPNWEKLEHELMAMINETNYENITLRKVISQLAEILHWPETSSSEATVSPKEENITDSDCCGIPSVDEEKAKAFRALLQRLGLWESYPKKLQMTEMLHINSLHVSSLSQQSPTEKELCFHYLYRLMMLDYNVRYLCLQESKSFKEQLSAHDMDMDDFFNVTKDHDEKPSCKETHIHPMDIQMAIFHCSDDFLRQHIFAKLSTCQFSLPLLVPDPFTGDIEFHLWELRQIKKTWQRKEQSESDSSGTHHTLTCSTPVPIVSFIRLGASSNSKSQILNNIISQKRHPVFFTRHCSGSTEKCLLMDGVVEIAWYCPGGQRDEIFDICVAFMNLHGDASKHPRQLEFLQEVSTAIVLLLSENPLEKEAKETVAVLYKSAVPLIILFSEAETFPGSGSLKKVRIAAKNRNEYELTKEITEAIKQCLSDETKTTSIERYTTLAKQKQFCVNEHKITNKKGNEKANNLLSYLKKEIPSSRKDTLLPLQGKLWAKWCKEDKQQNRLQHKTNTSLEYQISEIQARKQNIRNEQLDAASPLSDLMKTFLKCVSHSEGNGKLYMLQWLRILLDEETTEKLANLQDKYHKEWTKIKEKKQDIELHGDLNKISDEIQSTSFGLTHILREMGQLYEAVKAVADQEGEHPRYIYHLPEIAAEMLVSGYPLELMDGDVAHVAIEWIKAVIDRLIRKLGNKKVFVLSVLGLQSSGKSTLLNTMFGLQFAVSAGRCTRGAFMQLLTVGEEMREQLQYDLVLVVDSEGLRSPELSTETTLTHDNELATFIIGMGNMTLINIMGENTSEMQDILQICVQAFMRMKSTKINPSCIFVHQNVIDSSANQLNKQGKRSLLDKLDEMTHTAAEEENPDSGNKVRGFADIIQFDVDSQVFYFKSLLEGDPPMAPPNPSYSQSVQELKNKVLTIADWQPGCRLSSLSEFKVRLSDLWDAMLRENFVFSFRNTLEIILYNKLEENYGKWSWRMRKHALEIENKLHNQIRSEQLRSVDASQLKVEFDQIHKEVIKDVNKYFQEEKYQEILVQWRGNIDKRLERLRSELTEETVTQCKELLSTKGHRSQLDKNKSEYQRDLLIRSQSLASELQNKDLNDDLIRKEFNKLWITWSSQISSEIVPKELVNVEAVVENALLKRFEKSKDVISEILKKDHFQFKVRKHVSLSVREWVASNVWTIQTETTGRKLTETIQNDVCRCIRNRQCKNLDFTENFVYELLDEIEKTITCCETENKVEFTEKYRVSISVHICTKAVEKFKKIQADFQSTNDPLTYFDSQKEDYFKIFKRFCDGVKSVTIFADLLCSNIKKEIQEAVYDKTSIQIVDQLKSNHPAFNGNRSNLEDHILKDLAEKERFDLYMEYIHHPKAYLERFIREQVEEYCADGRNTVKLLNENLSLLIQRILSTTETVTSEVKERKGNLSMWLDEFCSKLGNHVAISKEDFKNFDREGITDLPFLSDRMAESLKEMLQLEEKENQKNSSLNLTVFRKRPDEILFKQMSGCWEQCPFCNAICTNTIPGHNTEHSVQFHRSKALAGWHFIDTDMFSIDFCTTSVGSDGKFRPFSDSSKRIPFKNYREAGPPYNSWRITADGSQKCYWKWFICAFRTKMEEKYKYKFKDLGEIPEEWTKFTKEDALQELNKSIRARKNQ